MPDTTSQPLNFLFAVHSHQPVGNFGHVFEELFEKCYRPYLEVLAKFPDVKTAAHYSGPLLEWLDAHHPGYLDRMRSLVEAGQLEILGGGFYEPLLATLPEEDALGQIEMMNDYVERRFGVRPRGLWLAERIWSPTLPRVIARAGIEFTILDDTHFACAGLDEQQIHGYFITENQGNPLKLFPISKTLRYSIPFDLPEATLDKLRNMRKELQCHGLTYADDGEKFGGWPETWQWVYGDGYLEKWFRALERNRDWIKTVHFGEYLDTHPPTGRVYLPPASYEEMMEWALPVEAERQLHDLKIELKDKGIDEAVTRRFLRGGLWDNFLVKYPASNRMHKRMLAVSRKVRQLPGSHPDTARAVQALYRGQCNCSYWHGLFGGLYLNYLRHAIYDNLITAETLARSVLQVEGLGAEQVDYDLDGRPEWLVSNSRMQAIVAPDRGGAVVEFDYRPAAFNITNVLERQEESYHKKILQHGQGGEDSAGGQPKSIHDRMRVKQEGLEQLLIYDPRERLSLQECLFPAGVTLDDLKRGGPSGYLRFYDQPFQSTGTASPGGFQLEMEQETLVNVNQPGAFLQKTLRFPETSAGILTRYHLENRGENPLQGLFGVEFNITLLAGDAEDRYFVDPGGEFDRVRVGQEGEVSKRLEWAVRDGWAGFEVRWKTLTPARILFYPIETVSQSEDGFEKTYQGTCLWFLWELDVTPRGGVDLEINWEIGSIQGSA